MRTQMSWAHQDGIGFFLFGWCSLRIELSAIQLLRSRILCMSAKRC
jgi:hypothetical protein